MMTQDEKVLRVEEFASDCANAAGDSLPEERAKRVYVEPQGETW
jgi:hypothetical protein